MVKEQNITSEDVKIFNSMLCVNICRAIESSDPDLIADLVSLWQSENWESILCKLDAPGSTWSVWWDDGWQSTFAGAVKVKTG